ncbi:unnamed protein product [Penicillium viridicatum]
MNLMADSSLLPPSWELRLDRLGELFNICLATGNHGPMHACIASDLNGEVDHRAVFYQLLNASSATTGNADHLRSLMDVNIRHISRIRDGYDSHVKKFSCQIGDDPNPDKLEGALQDLIKEMKGHSAEAWDKTTKDAKDVIQNLPANAHQQVSALEKALDSLEDGRCGCLHKLKSALRDALTVNQAAAEAAIKYTEAIYKIEPKANPLLKPGP